MPEWEDWAAGCFLAALTILAALIVAVTQP